MAHSPIEQIVISVYKEKSSWLNPKEKVGICEWNEKPLPMRPVNDKERYYLVGNDEIKMTDEIRSRLVKVEQLVAVGSQWCHWRYPELEHAYIVDGLGIMTDGEIVVAYQQPELTEKYGFCWLRKIGGNLGKDNTDGWLTPAVNDQGQEVARFKTL